MTEGLDRPSAQDLQAGKIPADSEIGQTRPTAPPKRLSAPSFTYGPGAQPLAGYTIKRGIGQGGFGEVYYAWSEAGKEVALKLIRRHQEIELRGLRQCLNLKHPHLVSLYDIRLDNQQNYWVIMEYVAGPSLQERIACWPNGLPLAEIFSWMEGICAGVEYLHDHGIVHRDLKPANIFCEEGIVKIGDYGLSKWLISGQGSCQTENVGTVHYMAPEVASGRYGKEIDIYALGVILYEMLTGCPPFEGQTAAEVLMKHLTAQPDLQKVPEAFRAVVAQALEKDPARRFASAGQMWEALGKLRTTLPESQTASPAASSQQWPSQGSQNFPRVALQAWASQPKSTLPELPGTMERPRHPRFVQILRAAAGKGSALWKAEGRKILGQFVVVGLGTWVLLATGPLLGPLAILALLAYGLYEFRGKIPLLAGGEPSGTNSGGNLMSIPSETKSYSPSGKPLLPVNPYEEAARGLRAKPLLQRLTELIGSLLVGAIVSLLMCGIITILYSYRHKDQSLAGEQIAWLALISTAGAWTVLIVSKFWEGKRGESLVRRLVLLVLGLGLGALGYVLSEWLWLDWESLENFPRAPRSSLLGQFYGRGGEPLLMAFLSNFAFLMALIRWDRQADPLRFARLNLWTVLVSVLAAALVAWVLRFPQPWLPMCAGLMSLAVQLAAPWAHPRRQYLR
ncbi:MAG: serine/threonine-protein kinase [Thermoguttaceae bacterium]|nr:serine/threonine-protein kinase [Thermoguttaceae bacterium]